MKLKKIIAASAAACTAMSAMALSASAEEVGTIGIYMADSSWAVQYWGDADPSGNLEIASASNAVIDGNGEYTASIEFNYAVEGIAFIALCSDIESASMPEGMNVDITSVEVNGSAIEFGVNGTPEWKDDAGLMRVNIYNGWSTEQSDWATNVEDYAGAQTVTVNFTVSGLAGDETAETEAAAETEAVAETEVVVEEAVSEETAEEAPPSDDIVSEPDSVTENSNTGNAPAAAFAAVMGVAAACMAVCKRK